MKLLAASSTRFLTTFHVLHSSHLRVTKGSSVLGLVTRVARPGCDTIIFFFFKAVLTSKKHQTTCCVLQLQAASSRSTSTDWLYDYPTGYITDPARRVAVGGSLTAHKSVEPPAQPPHRCLSNAVLYCWTTHVFSSFFFFAPFTFCYQTALVFQQMPGSHWQQVPPS